MYQAVAREVRVRQGSKEWFELRRGKFTASRFETVMCGSDRAVQTLLDAIANPDPWEEEPRAPALAWGKHYEPRARAEYTLITGYDVRACGVFVHDSLPAAGSPDGIIEASGSRPLFGIEIKCPYNAQIHLATLDSGVPRKHYHQIQGNMWLTGAPHWDFVSFDPRLKNAATRCFIQRIHRDNGYAAKLEARLRELISVIERGGQVYRPSKNATSVLFAPGKIKLF